MMMHLIVSIIIISLVGTLSHFLYDLTDHNKIVGLFTAVNESTWEHIKIALTPTLLWSLIDGYQFGILPNYFVAKCSSLLIIIILMPLLFYGYKAIFKKESVIFNISSFYIVIFASQYAFYNIISMNSFGFIYTYISCILTFLLFGGYMIHTLMPAKSFIFLDPISKKYGFSGHTEDFSIKKKH